MNSGTSWTNGASEMIPDWTWVVFWTVSGMFIAVGWWRDSDHSLSTWPDSDDQENLTPVDEVHQLYFDDKIGEEELEERLEVLVDDRVKTIRDLADDVDGIGDKLSRVRHRRRVQRRQCCGAGATR